MGKKLHKQDSYICKICLPYKIPKIFLILLNYFEFGPVFQEMSVKDISYLKHWQPFCSMEWNHLYNLGRVHHEEQFCEIILNLDHGSEGDAI